MRFLIEDFREQLYIVTIAYVKKEGGLDKVEPKIRERVEQLWEIMGAEVKNFIVLRNNILQFVRQLTQPWFIISWLSANARLRSTIERVLSNKQFYGEAMRDRLTSEQYTLLQTGIEQRNQLRDEIEKLAQQRNSQQQRIKELEFEVSLLTKQKHGYQQQLSMTIAQRDKFCRANQDLTTQYHALQQQNQYLQRELTEVKQNCQQQANRIQELEMALTRQESHHGHAGKNSAKAQATTKSKITAFFN